MTGRSLSIKKAGSCLHSRWVSDDCGFNFFDWFAVAHIIGTSQFVDWCTQMDDPSWLKSQTLEVWTRMSAVLLSNSAIKKPMKSRSPQLFSTRKAHMPSGRASVIAERSQEDCFEGGRFERTLKSPFSRPGHIRESSALRSQHFEARNWINSSRVDLKSLNWQPGSTLTATRSGAWRVNQEIHRTQSKK